MAVGAGTRVRWCGMVRGEILTESVEIFPNLKIREEIYEYYWTI
jgi:hypothetical protein